MPRRGSKRVYDSNFITQVKHRTHVEVDEKALEKIPKSFVIRKGKLNGEAPDLLQNFRIVMSPNTALHLKERKYVYKNSHLIVLQKFISKRLS